MDYIFGASGFIGSALRRRLPGARVIPRDQDLDLFGGGPGDTFYWCRAWGNYYSHLREEDAFQKAVIANVLEPVEAVMWQTGIRMVYLSSSSVGLQTATLYSRTKRAAEELLLSYGACVIRPYSVTGPGEQSGHLIPRVMNSMLGGPRVQVAPAPVHDFVHVEDVVDAMINLPVGLHEVGSGYGYSNRAVVELIELVAGRKANVVWDSREQRPYDTTRWVCKESAWNCQRTLRDAVSESWAALNFLRGAVA